MTNKEKFLALVSDKKSNAVEVNKERIKNRDMLRESQRIAIKVLMKLDELGWSQRDLAAKLEVSPQQITKIVSGKENLTIETQVKLQNTLKIPILASFYENKPKDWVSSKNKFVFFSNQKPISHIAAIYKNESPVLGEYKKSLNNSFAYPQAI